jgi:hypothetical protein
LPEGALSLEPIHQPSAFVFECIFSVCSFFGAGDQTQGFRLARQAVCHCAIFQSYFCVHFIVNNDKMKSFSKLTWYSPTFLWSFVFFLVVLGFEFRTQGLYFQLLHKPEFLGGIDFFKIYSLVDDLAEARFKL